MAGVLSIYVAEDGKEAGNPTVVMHLHPDLPMAELSALGLRLGALAMQEAAKAAPPYPPPPAEAVTRGTGRATGNAVVGGGAGGGGGGKL